MLNIEYCCILAHCLEINIPKTDCMDVLIVEDEQLLAMELAEKLVRLDETIKIVGQTESIGSTVEWLRANRCDLMFLDVHLSDGNSFSIFDKVKVDCPIIFTTAYDKYAIKAFELNSIVYLLKPVDEDDLKKALDKFRKIRNSVMPDINNLLNCLNKPEVPANKYIQRMMLSIGQKQMAMSVDDIAYFMADGRYLYAFGKDGKRYLCETTLYKLEEELNPHNFFRLNRRFMVSFDSVAYFVRYSKSRVKVKLKPELEEDVIISADKVTEFKSWLVR